MFILPLQMEYCLASVCQSAYRKFFHIFNFICRTAAWPVTKLTTNFPLGVLSKSCIFSELLEIQDGHPCFWLAKTFSTFQIVSVRVLKKCCFFSEQFEIHDCHPGLCFSKTFKTSFEVLFLFDVICRFLFQHY
jgi:hypothetical protein